MISIRCKLGIHEMFVQSTQKMFRVRDYNSYGWTSRYVFDKEVGKEQSPVTRINMVCRRCSKREHYYQEGWDY
jgi:hypothetical protein